MLDEELFNLLLDEYSDEEETFVFLLEDEAATELLSSLSLEQERVNAVASARAAANKENLILFMLTPFV
jgi:hypothetical protein